MKKLFLIIFSSLMLLLLVGCENFRANQSTEDQTTIPTEITEFAFIINILDNYDFSNTNGFDYSSKQTVEDIITNQDEIEQRIEWIDETAKIYTEYTSLRLAEFNLDKTHDEFESVNYFYNNQIGEYNEENNLIWQDITMEAYLDFSLPLNQLLEEYFSTYSVEVVDDQYILTGMIDTQYIDDILTTDQTNISDLEITVIVNQDNDNLEEISLTYQQDITRTEIIFTPYYDDAQVIIPE
ncbi:hypothetical protein KHQ88_04425 [Mycoplasmatota bacterium]|nr:hypothetical protein KHQ88_04425 [Mycoplasmatota bacterium]